LWQVLFPFPYQRSKNFSKPLRQRISLSIRKIFFLLTTGDIRIIILFKQGEEKMSKKLIKEFKNIIHKIPCFEIKIGKDEWAVWDIFYDGNGLTAVCDTHDFEDCSVQWDDTLSLDEHLQALFSDCFSTME
jgi:hypothetical protein